MTPHVYSNRSSGLQICNAHVSGVTHYVDRHELGLFERRDMLAFMREAGLRARFQEQGLMQGRGLCRGQGLSLRHRLERRRVGKGAVHAPGFASCKAQHRAHAERAFPRHTKRVGTVLLCATYKAVDVDRTFAHPYELRRMALAEDNVPAFSTQRRVYRSQTRREPPPYGW